MKHKLSASVGFDHPCGRRSGARGYIALRSLIRFRFKASLSRLRTPVLSRRGLILYVTPIVRAETHMHRSRMVIPQEYGWAFPNDDDRCQALLEVRGGAVRCWRSGYLFVNHGNAVYRIRVYTCVKHEASRASSVTTSFGRNNSRCTETTALSAEPKLAACLP
jgi:hypothetical protein